jgi:hypothetical protein
MNKTRAIPIAGSHLTEVAMTEDPGLGTKVTLTHKAAMAALAGLSVAFESALEAAVFPEVVEVKGAGPAASLAAISDEALRKMKNLPTQGLCETDEAAGFAAAISVVDGICARLRKETS